MASPKAKKKNARNDLRKKKEKKKKARNKLRKKQGKNRTRSLF